VIVVMSALTNRTDAVTVNVGGTVYMTTLATLTRVEGSMLGAMAEALSDGEVLFIDRDGPSFRYVLNYLRDPFAKPLLPRDPTDRDQLAREADFYGIPGLLSRPSTTEAAGGDWKGESACTQIVTQAELSGFQVTSKWEVGRNGREQKEYQWYRQFPCRDLRDCSLRYMDLTGWNLRGCNLAGVDATGADFTETDLRGCNLAGVDASGADFNSADLRGANLTGVNASGANFNSAQLHGANLTGVNASGANFDNANMSGANLSRANLQEASLNVYRLVDTNFTGANVRRANFKAHFREKVEREAARGDFFGPPFEPASPNWDPERNPGISRSVGAVFEW
jgi:uncharacterized protein YjbI with pentapeptide repeats